MATKKPGLLTSGAVDPSFGDGGKVTLNFPGGNFFSVGGMGLTPESKILAVGSTRTGQFIVGCLTEDGVVDTSFGQNGSMVGQFKGHTSLGASVHALGDGKILVVGTCVSNDQILPAACRLLPNGDFDPSFADSGVFVFPPMSKRSEHNARGKTGFNDARSTEGASTQAALLADGKILLLHPTPPDYHSLLIRLTADGVLDKGFNGTGYTSVRYHHPQVIRTYIKSFIATFKGDIIVCGHADLPGEVRGLLARYRPDGRPDTRFGNKGFVELPGPNNSTVDDLVLNVHGNLVGVGAMAKDAAVSQGAIAFGIMADDGSPDPSFNNGEIITLDSASRSEWYCAAMTPLTNNTVATGITFGKNFVNEGVIVGRYLRTGSLDGSFGNGKGWTILEPGYEPHLILQADGKVLICFVSAMANPVSCFVTRLLA